MSAITVATGPLQGVKVLELGVLVAGPLVGAYLGDLGADVVKVERPEGDPCRMTGRMEKGESLMWKYIGRSKRTIALDFANSDDFRTLCELIAQADILIENFRPGTMEKWNLGWEDLRRMNPRLVMARISGFGQSGPYRSEPGFGTVAESMSGFVNLNGWSDGPPTLAPIALADTAAAFSAALYAVSALLYRNTSGRGQMVDVGLLEPMFSYLGPQLVEYGFTGVEPQRMGNRLGFGSPRGAYQCMDGKWLALSGATPKTARSVFEAIGRSDMNEDPRFSTNEMRLVNIEEVDRIIGEWTATKPRKEAIDILKATGAAVGPVYNLQDSLEDDHFCERQVFTSVDDPVLGKITMPNVLGRLSDTPASIRFAGRPLDADRGEILSEWLGKGSESEIKS